MRNFLKVFTLVALLAMVFACSKGGADNSKAENYKVTQGEGFNIIENNGKPSTDEIKVDMKLVSEFTSAADDNKTYSISGFYNLEDDGSVIFLDMMQKKVMHVDKDGEVINSFGNLGTGPGEYQMPAGFACVKDTVFITDAMSQKLVAFTKSGEYIRDIKAGGYKQFQEMKPLGNGKLIAYVIGPDMREGKVFIKNQLSILNSKLEVEKVLKELEVEFDPQNPSMNPMDFLLPFAIGEKEVYVAEKSKDRFYIEVFDKETSERKMVIRYPYRRIAFTEKELEDMKELIKVQVGQVGEGFSDMFNNMNFDFKEAIYEMFVDKQNRLWVRVSEEDNPEKPDNVATYKIFKDGIYLNDCTITHEAENVGMKFMNGKIVTINLDDSKLSVYDY